MNLPIFRQLAVFHLVGTFTCSVLAAVESPFEVGMWENFCQAAVSHTFDDNTAGQTGVAQPLFDAKKMHMTLFTVTGSMNPNWTNLQNAFAKGHEIASHSVTHAQTMPDAECPTSQQTIREKVPGEMCVTIAYPNCNIPNPQTQLKKCYIAGRTCDGQIVNKSPSDFYRIGAIMAGSAGTNTASGFNSKSDEAATKNGWLVWCHHGVGNDGHGYSNTNTDALKGNIDYLDQHRDKFWVETFGNVARYIKERDAVSLSVKSSDDKTITVSVTDNLPDSIFNYPLTIRRPLPDGWTKAVVTQKGEAMEDTIVTVNSKQYVMFKVMPDGGDVVISQDAVGIRRSANFSGAYSNTVTLQGGVLTLDRGYFAGPSVAVTILNLTGKVVNRYTLGRGESKIPMIGNAVARSAFIARITSGTGTFSGIFMPHW